MNINVGLWIAAACALCHGCSPLVNSVRTILIEPAEYSRRCDDLADKKRSYALANVSWDEFRLIGQEAYSESFAHGFKEGFADYLYAGGPGTPPPVPPRCYWGPKYENPEGHKVIQDWFEGFRRGVAVAQSSGYRNWLTVPASTALPSRSEPVFVAPAGELLKEEVIPAPQGFPPPPMPVRDEAP